MTALTKDDWIDQSDEDLRGGLGMVLLAVVDPTCDPAIVDDLMAIGQDIRDELARRKEARELWGHAGTAAEEGRA